MTKKVTPMIHVPDVAATARWYETAGFRVDRTHSEDDEMNWALVSFGETEVMFSSPGHPSDAQRRDVDLYVNVDDINPYFEQLKERADIVEEPHDTFYGMREFIIRDLNRFWITFGQPME